MKTIVATAGLLGTSSPGQAEILIRLNQHVEDMYTAQQLDLEARVDRDFEPRMLERYWRIIGGITGSHVRLGLECGQLLADSEPHAVLSRAGKAIGLLRQIRDDFDYHHEPFGDF